MNGWRREEERKRRSLNVLADPLSPMPPTGGVHGQLQLRGDMDTILLKHFHRQQPDQSSAELALGKYFVPGFSAQA